VIKKEVISRHTCGGNLVCSADEHVWVNSSFWAGNTYFRKIYGHHKTTRWADTNPARTATDVTTTAAVSVLADLRQQHVVPRFTPCRPDDRGGGPVCIHVYGGVLSKLRWLNVTSKVGMEELCGQDS